MEINLPKIIGHRGVKDLAPENTLPSFEKAIKYNLKWIEMDVKISKDHIPFLLHDDILDRTTSGKGFPYNYNYEEIANMDAGSWFNKKFSHIYAPSLEEVIKVCSEKKIGINIELKPNEHREKENVDAICALMINSNIKCPYFFSSFDYKSIKLMRQKLPEASISCLVNKSHNNNNIQDTLVKCLDLKCFAIGFNLSLINQDLVNSCKKNNLKITVFSDENINYSKALELWQLGVDTIFVDNPIAYKKMRII